MASLTKMNEYIFTRNNAKINEFNKEYRGIDRPMDVLSLPSNEGMITASSEEEHHFTLVI